MPLVTLPSRTSRHGMIRLASIRVQPAEVVEQLEAGVAALLEMELRRDHVVAGDCRDELHTVVGRAIATTGSVGTG